jgi:hypothetical protein
MSEFDKVTGDAEQDSQRPQNAGDSGQDAGQQA